MRSFVRGCCDLGARLGAGELHGNVIVDCPVLNRRQLFVLCSYGYAYDWECEATTQAYPNFTTFDAQFIETTRIAYAMFFLCHEKGKT